MMGKMESLQVYKGPGIEASSMTFTDLLGTTTPVTFETDNTAEFITDMSFSPELVDHKSGKFEVTLTYTGFDTEYTGELDINIYREWN